LRKENKLAEGIHLRVGRELGETLFGSCYRYTATEQAKCQQDARGKEIKKKLLIGQGKRK
jgi:hypothetical protein